MRTPGFFRAQMTSDVLVRHYETVADASLVPVLLYNFTAVTGVKWETGRYEPEPNTRFAHWLYERNGWAAWTCGRQMLDSDGGPPTKAPAETADGD